MYDGSDGGKGGMGRGGRRCLHSSCCLEPSGILMYIYLLIYHFSALGGFMSSYLSDITRLVYITPSFEEPLKLNAYVHIFRQLHQDAHV